MLANKEDRDTLRLLRRTQKARERVQLLEYQLEQSVKAFGERRGYLFGCYREHNMLNDMRVEGMIE